MSIFLLNIVLQLEGNALLLYSNIYPTRCKVTQFIYICKLLYMFGWYLHPSSEAHITVSTASGICHTVTATCRYRGRVGICLSVLWVAYATHSTLKPIPTFHYSGR